MLNIEICKLVFLYDYSGCIVALSSTVIDSFLKALRPSAFQCWRINIIPDSDSKPILKELIQRSLDVSFVLCPCLSNLANYLHEIMTMPIFLLPS